MLAAFHLRFSGNSFVDHRAIDHMAGDARRIVDVLGAHHRAHAVGADQGLASEGPAVAAGHGDAVGTLFDALDPATGVEVDLAGLLRAF
jgi:hypothetical protein